MLVYHIHIPLYRWVKVVGEGGNFVFTAEFSQNSDLPAELYFTKYDYPCVLNKILVRDSFLQQKLIRFLHHTRIIHQATLTIS
jgi:hypothetical protein